MVTIATTGRLVTETKAMFRGIYKSIRLITMVEDLRRRLKPLLNFWVFTARLEAAPFQGTANLRNAALVFLASCCCLVGNAVAGDWSGPAQQLARKIVAVTGPGAVSVTVENRSSLGKKDVDTIGGALRVELEALGARSVHPEQAAALAAVWLSENPQSYVWVAEVRQGAGAPVVVMVAVPRANEVGPPREGAAMSLRKTPLWAQEDRILDVVVLEEDSALRHMAVLDGEKVAIYRRKNGEWKQEQSLGITHARPWPRDLRGRMVAAKDHLLDVYLPGVFCRSTTNLPLTLSCRESDDPWPLAASGLTVPPLGGFYSATRNFFTGALAPGVGKQTIVAKFYSAAPLPREKYVLWFFAGTDGQIHMIDGVMEQSVKLGWGSDVVSVKTACGSGWQVMASGANGRGLDTGLDSVKAYEVGDRDPIAVSAALDFSGEITALLTEGKGDSAVAVVRNRETGEYEAFRLAVGCTQ